MFPWVRQFAAFENDAVERDLGREVGARERLPAGDNEVKSVCGSRCEAGLVLGPAEDPVWMFSVTWASFASC